MWLFFALNMTWSFWRVIMTRLPLTRYLPVNLPSVTPRETQVNNPIHSPIKRCTLRKTCLVRLAKRPL